MTQKRITAVVFVVFLALLVGIGLTQFIRARNTPASNACINNLRQIDAGKQQWALEHGASSNAIPTWDEIRPYISREPSEQILRCPHGGTYTIGRVAEYPRCSFPHDSLDPKQQ